MPCSGLHAHAPGAVEWLRRQCSSSPFLRWFFWHFIREQQGTGGSIPLHIPSSASGFFCHFSGKPWGICGCCVLSPTPNDFKWHWVLGQKGSSDIRILNPSPRLPGNYHRPNNGHLKPALTNGTQILFNLDDKSLSLQKDKIIAAQMHKQNIWPRASALTKQKCHEARPL